MAEHISRQAFVDFGWYDLVKPLEIRFPKLGIQNDNRSIWIGSWVFVITFEKVWLRPERETVRSITRAVFYWFIMSELYLSLFTSQVLFSAVLLKFLHHTSLLRGRWKMLSSQMEEAHWTLSKKKQQYLSRTFNRIWHFSHVQAFNHKTKSSSWYLLEGVYCCRVGSQGEGELQHVHLDGAEQGAGFLHNQVIVGLICVCMRTVSTNRSNESTLCSLIRFLFLYSTD